MLSFVYGAGLSRVGLVAALAAAGGFGVPSVVSGSPGVITD